MPVADPLGILEYNSFSKVFITKLHWTFETWSMVLAWNIGYCPHSTNKVELQESYTHNMVLGHVKKQNNHFWFYQNVNFAVSIYTETYLVV